MTGRLVLVEDDEPVRASLVAILDAWGFQVTDFADGESFLASGPGDAECILLDVRLPGIDGLEVLRQLRQAGQDIPVIILTGHGDVTMAVEALKDGASDFIEKPFDDADLVDRINAALKTVSPRRDEPEKHRTVLSTLTPRETEIMLDVVAGHPNKIIAHRRGLSPKTVEIHRARVMDKTGATSLSHLVRMALKAGVDPDEGV